MTLLWAQCGFTTSALTLRFTLNTDTHKQLIFLWADTPSATLIPGLISIIPPAARMDVEHFLSWMFFYIIMWVKKYRFLDSSIPSRSQHCSSRWWVCCPLHPHIVNTSTSSWLCLGIEVLEEVHCSSIPLLPLIHLQLPLFRLHTDSYI